MLEINRSIMGTFIAYDIKNDLNAFYAAYKETVGFIGVKASETNVDEAIFIFDDNLISNSSALDFVIEALSSFLPVSLNVLKREVSDFINEERDRRLYSYFPYDGARWDCDTVSRANIIGTVTFALMMGGNLPEGSVWKDYDNVIHPVTFNYMAQMGGSLLQYTNLVYGASWVHKANIDALSNEAAIKNYDYINGWPSQSF